MIYPETLKIRAPSISLLHFEWPTNQPKKKKRTRKWWWWSNEQKRQERKKRINIFRCFRLESTVWWAPLLGQFLFHRSHFYFSTLDRFFFSFGPVLWLLLCFFFLSLLSRSSSDIRNYYFRFELYILPYHFTVNMVRIFFFHSSLSLYGGKLRTPHIFGFSTNGCKNGEC